jgi:hypothetical protein
MSVMSSRFKTDIAKRKSSKAGDSLEGVYEQIKHLLAEHAPPFKLRDLGVRNKQSAQLVVPRPVAVPGAYGGRPVDLQMAAVILQKDYVGFYVMAIYMNPAAKKELRPEFLKLLKGKTCFHIKKFDEELKKDINAALQLGTAAYRQRGWL